MELPKGPCLHPYPLLQGIFHWLKVDSIHMGLDFKNYLFTYLLLIILFFLSLRFEIMVSKPFLALGFLF